MSRPLRLRQLIQLEILNAARGNGSAPETLEVDGVDEETTSEVVRELREQGLLAESASRNGAAEDELAAQAAGLTEEGREYRRLLARKHRRAGGGTVAQRTNDSGSRGGCPDDL